MNGGYLILLLIIAFLIYVLFRRGQTSEPPVEPPPGRDTIEHHYFIPGQISVLVEHTPGLDALAVTQELYKVLVTRNDSLRDIVLDPRRVYRFDTADPPFSIAFADVPHANDIKTLQSIVNQLNQSFEENPPQPLAGDPIERPGVSRQTHSLALSAEVVTAPRSTVSGWSAGINWLLSGAGKTNGPGSPGGWPRPVPAAKAQPKANGQPIWSIEPPITLGLPKPTSGEGIAVYVLDTLPSETDLKNAYQIWGEGGQIAGGPAPINEQIASLLVTPGPIVEKIYAADADLLGNVNYYIPDHDYVMNDHGLFVAGIIHALAPQAEIHMVQVLNPYGVGSIESIINGFAIAAKAAATSTKQVVVNASLSIDAPTPDRGWLARRQHDDSFWQSFTADEIYASIASLERVCHQLRIVAAAGNENDDHGPQPDDQKRPPAGLPAGFPGVVGVAALDHKQQGTTYTNSADWQQAEGFAVFGGEVTDGALIIGGQPIKLSIPDRQNSLVGPYIGAFPDGSRNETGWAYWAGTSFATPVVTGIIAGLMSSGLTFEQAVAALRNVTSGTAVKGAILPIA